MGIKGLTQLIGDNAPNAIKENEIKNYFGRKIAIDASMSLYQFLIAVRPDNVSSLTDESGETTSHIQGMFHRTIRMMKHGIKPVFVFDGKPPELKYKELKKRKEKREEAIDETKEAKEEGNLEQEIKMTKRTVRVTPQHTDDCKKLLRLMGVPIIEAPCEAEAQCAAMCKAGLVFGSGSEDMDTLTLGTPLLLRHLTFSEARKMPIKEIYLDKALFELNLTMDQFIDLCILLGCDYSANIRGIGPVRALELIKKYSNIETIIKTLDKKKYTVPEELVENLDEIRNLFRKPNVIDPKDIELKWTAPDEDGLIQFLVKEKGFNEERVRSGIKKLNQTRSTSVQGRITSFFGEPKITPKKRKVEEKKSDKKGAKKPKFNATKNKKSKK